MPKPPSGTITFLLTDIEGSTRLWADQPEAMSVALARHDALLRAAIEDADGYVVKTAGDSFFAAFATPIAAIQAAIGTQRTLLTESWSGIDALRVRMALHTGMAELRGGDYFGTSVNRAARLLSAAHGGQILVSQAAYDLVRDDLPVGVVLGPQGEHRLKDLSRPEVIFQVEAEGLPSAFPPLRTLDNRPNNLPLQLTTFVGRECEIDDLRRLLETARLVTLTGVGGAGKTRLALQAGAELLETFTHGVWIAELAPVADSTLLPQAVAAALGVQEEPGRPVEATLQAYLREKHLLLILDNCEHVLDASARLADHLLHDAPYLRVLATSREALGIAGEHLCPVPSLTLPEVRAGRPIDDSTVLALTQYEAVRLFIDRAVSIQPGFQVDNENAPAVAQVCNRLDGIPLAIELAAARVRALSVAGIAERLDDRFHLLTGGSRTALPRQQTLQAAIDWSYDLLSPTERLLFARLAVFQGGWTLEASESVCQGGEIKQADVVDLLLHLVDKSLVVTDHRENCERYRALETVRQYARDKLVESGTADVSRIQHLNYFLAFAEDAAPKLDGPDQLVWVKRLEDEHDNLRAAIEHSVAGGSVNQGMRLATALWRFWDMRSHFATGREYMRALLSTRDDEGQTALRAGVLCRAGALALRQGDLEAAERQLDQGLTICRQHQDRAGEAFASRYLGDLAFRRSEFESALSRYADSLSIYEQRGDNPQLAGVLHMIGSVSQIQGDPESAEGFFERSLALWRTAGDRHGSSAALASLGGLAQSRGRYDQAKAFYDEVHAIQREIGDKRLLASTLGRLGGLHVQLSDYDSARAAYDQSSALFHEVGDLSGIATAHASRGMFALDQGDFQLAEREFTCALAKRRELGDRSGEANSLRDLGRLAQWQGDFAMARAHYEVSLGLSRGLGVRAGIGSSLLGLGRVLVRQGHYPAAEAALDEFLSIGRELGQQLSISIALDDLGMTAWWQGDCETAERLHRESIAISRAIGRDWSTADSLYGLGRVADSQGQYERAREHFLESLAIFRRLNVSRGVSIVLDCLGKLAFHEADYPEAERMLQQSLTIRSGLNETDGIASCLESLGWVAAGFGQLERAARLLAAAEAIRSQKGYPLHPVYRADHEASMTLIRNGLSAEVCAHAWAQGSALSITDAVAYAHGQDEV